METTLNSHDFKSQGLLKEDERLQDLKAKILALETELKRQREEAERGSKLLKLMWGDKFETDSLF